MEQFLQTYSSFMNQIGFHASHEQWPPGALLRFVRQAEQAGFQAAMCSDHFHPWSERQGHSGYTWSWLGSALEATHLSFGTVCAPGDRYHPAIIAQAAATLAEMYPGRFWLSVGSGEALNERITGRPWPEKDERNERLLECVQVMRSLWAGDTVTHDGLVQVLNAKLYSLPKQPPRLLGAAISAETAAWVGGWADGLITVGKGGAAALPVLDAFRANGGAGKPAYLQIALSYGQTDAEALEAAYDQWRQCALSPEQLADLESPAAFDQATQNVTRDEVRKCLRISADLRQHRDWLAEDLSAGFDAIYLHPIHRDVERFIDDFGEYVLPALPSMNNR